MGILELQKVISQFVFSYSDKLIKRNNLQKILFVTSWESIRYKFEKPCAVILKNSEKFPRNFPGKCPPHECVVEFLFTGKNIRILLVRI